MKTVANIRILLICFLVLFFKYSYSYTSDKNQEYDSLICLELSGKIKLKGNTFDNKIKIELIYYNTVVDSLVVKTDKKFKFYLKKNSDYTLRISKEGYITKIITVCTVMKKFDPETNFYKFHFDTELLPSLATEILNPEVLEFPIAIISFNEKLGAFYINEKYTSNIKQESFYK